MFGGTAVKKVKKKVIVRGEKNSMKGMAAESLSV